MARTLKGTRARGLPPKLLLSRKQDATGSFPTTWRTSSDNRTGRYGVFFNDNKTVEFNLSTTGDIGISSSYPDIAVNGITFPLRMTPQAINAGLYPEDIADLYKQPYFSGSVVVNQPIVVSGSMTAGVSDTFVTFTPGQDIEPFTDLANPESDAKELSVTSSMYQFYATGSLVETTGLGFQQPLWSKNKIEIDLTPSTTQSFVLYKSASVGSYPMGYWNPTTKLYEGIGTGKGIDSYSGDLDGLKLALDEQTFGFHTSIDFGGTLTGLPEAYNLYGRQISNYGFPYHSKFQPTSSQLLAMDRYISEPFLLEKICIELSSSMSVVGKSPQSPAMWTFFLLNKRPCLQNKQTNAQSIQYQLGGSGAPSTFLSSSLLVSSTSEVVDIIQMCLSQAADVGGYLNRELLINSDADIQNGQWLMNSTVKSSVGFEEGVAYIFSGSLNSPNSKGAIPTLQYSGRNQIDQTYGRDWVNAFENPLIVAQGSYYINEYDNALSVNAQYTKPNPYILLPSDRLTFGFQLPWDNDNGIDQNSLSFATTGINKIILYGSTLRVNPETNQLEEYHDTLNQLLSSNSVHEIIGE